MSCPSNQKRMQLGWKRKIGFALIAIALASSPLVVCEFILWLRGWENSSSSEKNDPFIGFSGSQSLFEMDNSETFYQIRASRHGYFRPARFVASKPAKSFRVFVVGGSTVQGRPWETETAFPKWLELALKSCEPESHVEVVNCGGVSYASYRLSLIVEEIVNYSPDLIILCTGHNEFLENRTYPAELTLPPFAKSLHRLFSLSRTYRWIRSKVGSLRSKQSEVSILDEKVITRLDFENGLDQFDESSLQRNSVHHHFRFNLEKMILSCREHGVKMMILAPAANQKDCFPFKPHDRWSTDDQSSFAELSLDELNSVLNHDRAADYFFYRGVRNLEAGNLETAKADFDQAIDRDICPLRMTSALREEMLSVVTEAQRRFSKEDVIYLDLNQRSQEEAVDGIVGQGLLVDHVHPTINTHKKWAIWILDRLHRQQLVLKPENWLSDFEAASRKHLDSLGFGYFQRGRERLDSVLKWSRGRAINPYKASQ